MSGAQSAMITRPARILPQFRSDTCSHSQAASSRERWHWEDGGFSCHRTHAKADAQAQAPEYLPVFYSPWALPPRPLARACTGCEIGGLTGENKVAARLPRVGLAVCPRVPQAEG